LNKIYLFYWIIGLNNWKLFNLQKENKLVLRGSNGILFDNKYEYINDAKRLNET
jgi:hypothetical protein